MPPAGQKLTAAPPPPAAGLSAEARVERFVSFSAMLAVRVDDYLAGRPAHPALRDQQLCNADRRNDRTTLYVINEILAKRDGAEMLLHLAIMRCGPNVPERYEMLVGLIDNDFDEKHLVKAFADFQKSSPRPCELRPATHTRITELAREWGAGGEACAGPQSPWWL